MRFKIEGIVNVFLSYGYQTYIHLPSGKIVFNKSYDKLLCDEWDKCLKLPTFDIRVQEKIAEAFVKTKLDKAKQNIFYSEYLNKISEPKGFMNSFHWFCEDNNVWVDFLDYQEKEYTKIAIKWCEENNLEYY